MQTTMDVVRATLRADPSVTPGERARLLALLRNGNPGAAPAIPTGPRLLRHREVAERLGVSKRTVQSLLSGGILRPVTLPGRKRALGVAESDVCALLVSGGARA